MAKQAASAKTQASLNKCFGFKMFQTTIGFEQKHVKLEIWYDSSRNSRL